MRKSRTDPALIPYFISEGLSDEEIAERMGWTVGTLRVRCSQLKISLRRKVSTERHIALPKAIVDQLQQYAATMGISASSLAIELLEAITRDRLYRAVLDRDDGEAVHAHTLAN